MALLRAAAPCAEHRRLARLAEVVRDRRGRSGDAAAALPALETALRRKGWVAPRAVGCRRRCRARRRAVAAAQRDRRALRAAASHARSPAGSARCATALAGLRRLAGARRPTTRPPGARRAAPRPEQSPALLRRRRPMTLDEFAAWVDSALEERVLRAAARRGDAPRRHHAAGARDAAAVRRRRCCRAPTRSGSARDAPPHPLLGDALAQALGLPDAAQRRDAETLAFAQLLRCPQRDLAAPRRRRRRAAGAQPAARAAAPGAAARPAARSPMRRDPRRRRRPSTPQPCRARCRGAPTLLPRSLSASACEALRACPYRFFALRMLGAARGRRARRRHREARLRQLAARGAASLPSRARTAPAPAAEEARAACDRATRCSRSMALDDAALPAVRGHASRASCRATSTGCTSATRTARSGSTAKRELRSTPAGMARRRDARTHRPHRQRAGADGACHELIDYKTGSATSCSSECPTARGHPARVLCRAGARSGGSRRRSRRSTWRSTTREGIERDRAQATSQASAAQLDRRHRPRPARGCAAAPRCRRSAKAALRVLRSARPVPARPLGTRAAKDPGEQRSRPRTRSTAAPSSREAFYAAACDPRAQRRRRGLRRRRQDLDAGVAHPARAARRRRSRTRSSRSRSPARPPARCARGSTSGCATSPRRHAATSSAPRELRERGLDAAQARAARAARSRRCTSACSRGGRTVEVRTFHAWFSQLLRAAPLELLAELGLQPEMELIEDPSRPREPRCYRRFHAAVLADAGSCATTIDALVRAARPRAGAQAGSMRRGTSASRSSWPTPPARSTAACRRAAALWPASAGARTRSRRCARPRCARSWRDRCAGARAGVRHAAGSGALARAGARADDDAAGASSARGGAVHRRRARRASSSASAPGWPRRQASLERSSSSVRAAGRARRAPAHGAPVARAAGRVRRATSARAAWPTWPTSSAARWRCCATRRWPAGCRSGSTRACATC